jgi:hypothetical protein
MKTEESDPESPEVNLPEEAGREETDIDLLIRNAGHMDEASIRGLQDRPQKDLSL